MLNSNEQTMWGIHGGQAGDANTLFLKQNMIALGWVVRCLGFLIKGDIMMWTTSIWEKVVRHILISALQNEIQREAKTIISGLAFHDMTDFLDLLPRKE